MGGDGNGGRWAFTIPCLPPSQNALHDIIYSQRRVVLKPTVLKWCSDAKLFVPRIQLQSSSLVEVNATFYFSLYYANGKVRKQDSANLLKILLDVIANKVGFDDSRIRRGSWDSVDDKNERVEVVLSEYALTASAPAPESSEASSTTTADRVTTDS